MVLRRPDLCPEHLMALVYSLYVRPLVQCIKQYGMIFGGKVAKSSVRAKEVSVTASQLTRISPGAAGGSCLPSFADLFST